MTFSCITFPRKSSDPPSPIFAMHSERGLEWDLTTWQIVIFSSRVIALKSILLRIKFQATFIFLIFWKMHYKLFLWRFWTSFDIHLLREIKVTCVSVANLRPKNILFKEVIKTKSYVFESLLFHEIDLRTPFLRRNWIFEGEKARLINLIRYWIFLLC